MKSKKNEAKKDINDESLKRRIKEINKRTNPKLLLFKSKDRIKNKSFILDQKNSFNTKLSVNAYNIINNKKKIQLNYEIKQKISNESIIKNGIKRPFSLNLTKHNSNRVNNQTSFKNKTSLELIEVSKSISDNRKINSLNIISQSIHNRKIKSLKEDNSNEQKIISNNNRVLNFEKKLYNQYKTPLIQKLDNLNDKSKNTFVNMSSNSNLNTSNIFIQDSKNDFPFSYSFVPIKSIKKQNRLNSAFHSLDNKNQKNIFLCSHKSRSLNNSPHYRIRKKFQENYKRNDNELIEYRNVLYTGLNNKYNKEIRNRIRQYNKELRIRNEIKNIDEKNNEEKNKVKRYSFYKYDSYMDKIEKEEINKYKILQKKKKEINIKKLFEDKSKLNYENIINKRKEIKNLLNNKDKNKLLSYEQFENLQKQLKLNNIFENKNDINININLYSKKQNDNNDENIELYPKIQNKNQEIEKANNSEESSTSEMPIIIDNYIVQKKGVRKLRKNKTAFIGNSLVKKLIDEDILLGDEYSFEQNSVDLLSDEVNKIKKDEYLISLGNFIKKEKKIKRTKYKELKNKEIITEETNNEKSEKNLNFFPKKIRNNKINDKDIFDNLRKNYYQKREKMLKMNRKNILAKKILLQRIAEMEKIKQRFRKYHSIFGPFHNLTFKYTKKEMNERKNEILEKYSRINYDKNKYSVRLKNRSQTSFFTNKSANISHVQFIFQNNEIKNDDFSFNDLLDIEQAQKNTNEKEKETIKIYPNENDYNIKEIEKIDKEINFEENEEDMKEKFKKRELDKKERIKQEEIKLNKMIKEQKKKKLENEFLKKYEKIIKVYQEKEKNKNKKKIISKEMLIEMGNNFTNLMDENDAIIKSSRTEDEAELFIQFREKLKSLTRYSVDDLNMYLYRNFDVINNILAECKRDKQKENRINRFIRMLKEDLDQICYKRNNILKSLKVLDFLPFPNNTINV